MAGPTCFKHRSTDHGARQRRIGGPLQGYGAPRLVGRHTLLAEARLRGGGGQTDKRGLGADVLKPIE